MMMTCDWRWWLRVGAAAGVVMAGVVGSPGVRHAGAQAQWPVEFAPRPLAARDVTFPAYESRTLSNGLQVVTVLHHEQPVVSMRLIVRAGSALDPKGKQGLANVAAALLDQGTATRTARELNDEIDFIGGELGAGSLPDLTFINVVVMKDSFDTGLKMLSEVVRRPAFAQEELDRQRQQMLSGLQVSFEDPGFVADAVFNRLVYGFHPYGMLETGTPDTLAAITREDLVAFHHRNFVANNAILAIVGDVTADEAFEGVRRVFGDWERRDVPPPQATTPPSPTRRVVVINKPDAVQTEVRVGHLGVRRNQSDYMPINLAIRVLGGEGANRLHQILRTDRGLTYGAQADMRTLKDSGDFVAKTSTRSDATGQVLRLIVEQIQRLQRERVNDRELADAKAYLTGSFPLTIETPDAIATQVLNVLFFGLPVEELQSFRDRVNSVRPVDIERVARSYLLPERLSIVLVGNAAAFASQLRGAGFGSFETIEMNDLDLTAADFKRARSRASGSDAPGLGRPAASYQSSPAQSSPAIPGRPAADADAPRRIQTPIAVARAAMPTPSGDPATSLIARQDCVAGGPGQPLIEEAFVDDRAVDGVQSAFTARVRSGGRPVLDRRVTDIRINPPLDSSLLTRPVT
ncbi:MAG: insulinase family protein [Acidobacteria bacterium]|nr:insulinase family protein [Acidobacteriota bacterium]